MKWRITPSFVRRIPSVQVLDGSKIIITIILIQEENIFGIYASLTYGSEVWSSGPSL